MSPIQARLDLEPKDAVAFFAGKGEQLAWDYTEVMGEANVHAFTVAKATSLELLRTIRAETAKAIGPGQSFEQFKKALRPRLEEMGWWGKQEVLDIDTGEITQAQLGSVRRLRTIYQANVQSAYMAGRYKRYVANAVDRPYWRYVAIMDGRTRPAHAALNGKIFRWDDPIWKVIWPPNGWGCRCRVVALTQAEFDALGLPLEDGSGMIFETEVPINRDGDMVTVKGVRYTDASGKQRIFQPDPGWDYNPGKAWARFDPAAFKGEAIEAEAITPPAPGGVIKASGGQLNWKYLGRPDLRSPDVPRLPAPQLLPEAADRDAAAAMLRQALIPDGTAMRVIETPLDQVVIREEWLPHMVEKRANTPERYANFVAATLQNPFEVWLTAYADGTYRKRYIGVFAGPNDLLVVLRENRDGSLWWEVYNMMQRDAKGLNKPREGTLLYGVD